MKLKVSTELLRELLHLPACTAITGAEFRAYEPHLVLTVEGIVNGRTLPEGEGNATVYTRPARQGDCVIDRVELEVRPDGE